MEKTKSSLRKHFSELLKKQGSQERTVKSQAIAAQVFELSAFIKAKTVLFYASMPGEVDTFAMISKALQLKKNVAIPVIVPNQRTMIPTLINSVDDLYSGTHGIMEPRADKSKAVSGERLDLVIVPGLAFDRALHRLGRGAGYYDRFLADLPDSVTTVGTAFDFQVVDSLPIEDHDISLDLVIAG